MKIHKFPPTWETKDGVRMNIPAMETSHLQFSLSKILRQNNWRRSFTPYLVKELAKRYGYQLTSTSK